MSKIPDPVEVERDVIRRLALELRELADEAAKAVTEPRRFMQNEDNRQQVLAVAVARSRSALRKYEASVRLHPTVRAAEDELRARRDGLVRGNGSSCLTATASSALSGSRRGSGGNRVSLTQPGSPAAS